MSNKRVVRSDIEEAWAHVEKINGDHWKCKFCGDKKSGHVRRVQAHLGRVPCLGIAPCEGDVPPDLVTRMRTAANLENENKKRKQASGSGSSKSNPTTAGPPPPSGASNSSAECANTLVVGGAMGNWQDSANLSGETSPRVTFPQQEPPLSVSDYSQELWDPDALLVEPAPSSYALDPADALNTNAFREAGASSNVACGQRHADLSSNTGGANASVQAPEEEGREYSMRRNTLGAGSCQPQTSTLSTQQRFASDTTQPINNQGVSRAPFTNLNDIEDMLNWEHFRTTLASSADQQQCHESTSSSQNQLNTGLEPSAPPPQMGSLVQSSGICNLDDFWLDFVRRSYENMWTVVGKAKTLTSMKADFKTQLEERESITVKKRKEVVDNWLQRVDQKTAEVVDTINEIHKELLRSKSLKDLLCLHLTEPLLSHYKSALKALETKNDRIVELAREVDELIKEGKSLSDPTVDVVLPRKFISCRSQVQDFVEQHFKLVM